MELGAERRSTTRRGCRSILVGLTILLYGAVVGCSADDSTDPERSESDASQGSTVIRASDYDQSCETARDCAVVWEGDVCPCIPCQTAADAAAIRQSAKASYDEDLRELRDRCDRRANCKPCARRPAARCTAQNECAIERPDASGAAD